jgi:alpha,alpha-trehalase
VARIKVFALIFALWLCTAFSSFAQAPQPNNYSDLLSYIDKAWGELTRSMTDCDTVMDKRVPEHSVVYLPAGYPEPASLTALQSKCKVAVKNLPEKITRIGSFDMSKLQGQGVLYLPNPYVVPGGFLNEMYGWDSYFIIVGLLRAGRFDMARGMVENFFFEIDHYGGILNANRTYFLTRSQPPFLSSMVMAVCDAQPDAQAKRAWLEKAYPYIQRDYEMWTSGQKLAGDTGLSRYYDFGEGAVPEIADMHDSYYRDVFRYLQASQQKNEYLGEPGKSSAALTGASFTFQACEQDQGTGKSCENSPTYEYTADYYKGDRAMRESGFDISFRFGDFSGSTHHYAAVCLNSLLYKTEKDMETISKLLGKPAEATEWAGRAQQRKALINRYLWDAQRGMFFDYDFVKGKRSEYQYLSTFYPLWAGLATPEQAKAVVANLRAFARAGGLAMSPYETGVQWDLPYGWAPTHLLAVEGMRRYGFKTDADRVAREWVDTVATNFRRDGTIREKYDVVSGTSTFAATAGYKENVVGFGWTNAVTLQFAYELGLVPGKAKAAGN